MIRLDQYRKSGDLKTTGKQAMRYETVGDVRRALDDVLAVLDGREPTMRLPAEEQVAAPVVVKSAPPPATASAPPVKTGPVLVRDEKPKGGGGGEEQPVWRGARGRLFEHATEGEIACASG